VLNGHTLACFATHNKFGNNLEKYKKQMAVLRWFSFLQSCTYVLLLKYVNLAITL